jgi:hypothetical protein
VRVTFVRTRGRLVLGSPAWVRVVGSSVGVDGPEVSDGDVVEVSEPDVVAVSDGPAISVVVTGPVVVMVAVGVVVDGVGVDDENDGSTNWVGASSGLLALLVRLTTPHTSKASTPSAATLAPTTAGVEWCHGCSGARSSSSLAVTGSDDNRASWLRCGQLNWLMTSFENSSMWSRSAMSSTCR